MNKNDTQKKAYLHQGPTVPYIQYSLIKFHILLDISCLNMLHLKKTKKHPITQSEIKFIAPPLCAGPQKRFDGISLHPFPILRPSFVEIRSSVFL